MAQQEQQEEAFFLMMQYEGVRASVCWLQNKKVIYVRFTG